MRAFLEEKTNNVSGKELEEMIGINPEDYVGLYSGLGEKNYCPCKDIKIEGRCKGMITVMEAFKQEEIEGVPLKIKAVREGKYRTGDIYVDNMFDLVYLYLGKSPRGRDVALNLGGGIEIGNINKNRTRGKLRFDRKVFPRNGYNRDIKNYINRI